MDDIKEINNIDIINDNIKNDIDDINNTDTFIKTEYFLCYKRMHYINKVVENYYFSKFLIIYKYYYIKHKVLRKKTFVYKNNNNIEHVEKYCLNGEIIK